MTLAAGRAPVQRGLDRQGAQHADVHVHQGKADFGRRRVLAVAGHHHHHHAGQRPHHMVVGAAAGPAALLTVARERAVDDVGLGGADVGIRQPVPGRKFSMNTSAVTASRRTRSARAALRMSTTSERLPALSVAQQALHAA